MYSHILSKYLSCAHQLLLADVTDNHLYRSAFAKRLTKISYFANEAIWKHRSAFAEWLTLITRTGGIVAQNCCSRYMAEKGDAPKASPKHPITITLTLPVFYRIKGQNLYLTASIIYNQHISHLPMVIRQTLPLTGHSLRQQCLNGKGCLDHPLGNLTFFWNFTFMPTFSCNTFYEKTKAHQPNGFHLHQPGT